MRRAVAITTSMGLAALATLPTLGRQPLSWDEAVTLGAARRTPGLLWSMLGHTDAPLGLYYFGMHLWLSLGEWLGTGAAAWWLRLPSALAGIAAVGVLVVLVARWFGSTAGLISGVLLAVHPMLTFYSQDARPYTLVVLAFLISTLTLLWALESPVWQRFLPYAVTATGCLYLHLFSGYALAAHVVLVLTAATDRRRALRAWSATMLVVALAVTPLVLVARGETGEVAWIAHPTPGVVLAVLTRMAGGGWLAIALIAVAVVAMVRRSEQQAERRPGQRSDRRVAFLAGWLALPVLALVLVDFLVPDLVARYGLVCVPAAAGLAGWAAVRRGRVTAALVAVAIVIAAATTWHQQAQPYKYEDYREAADVMGDLAHPGDAVMFFPMSMRAGFDTYRSLEPDLGRLRDAALAPGGAPVSTDQISGIDRPPQSMAGAFGTSGAIFVLGTAVRDLGRSALDRTDQAQLAVLAQYRIVRTLRWGVVTLTQLQRRASLDRPLPASGRTVCCHGGRAPT